MTTAAINVCAASILIVWAVWCGMSRSVNDGVIGKAIYAVIAMSSFSVLKQPSDNQAAFTVLLVMFALLGVRHYVLRKFKGKFKWL